jgi:hypothetical protein
MKLKLENYVFAMLEGHIQFMEYLGEYSWEFRIRDGSVVFTPEDHRRAPVESTVQILGTASYRSRTWLWGWATRQSNIPASLLSGVERVRQQAEQENNRLFADAGMISIQQDDLCEQFAIICSGYVGAFTYFVAPYTDGAMYVAIERRPKELTQNRNAMRVMRVIESAISTFSFSHQDALFSFLGAPASNDGGHLSWKIDYNTISVSLDDKERIETIQLD